MIASVDNYNISQFTPGAQKILHTAERLFAEQGITAVSTRMIAKESGQKNCSAMHYHFGNLEGLIEAILEYRITPVNQSRNERLTQLKNQARPISIELLVAAFVEPFTSELLKTEQECYYVSLLAQLYASQRGRELYAGNRQRSRALHALTAQLVKALQPAPIATIHFRLQLMGRQTVTSVAEWAEARRQGLIELDKPALRWRTAELVDYIVGGLRQPVR